jgi:hypothetical protein
MSLSSPTLEGFREAFRRPSITLAEVVWRWTVGAVASALFFFGLVEYLGTLSVNNVDATLLRTRQPLIAAHAIKHILRGSLDRAVFTALAGALALSLLWIIAASIGRAATIRALLDPFRGKTASNASTGIPNASASYRSLIGLNFLRVATALAAILAFLGAAILATLASSDANPQPGLVFVIFIPLAAFICLVWQALNWLLSLASIFALRDAEDALAALSAAVTFLRERTGSVAAVSTWTGLAHLVAISTAASAIFVPLAFVPVAPARLIAAIVILITLAYFAIVDWLYIARLAAYICIAENPEASASAASMLAPPVAGEHFAPSTPAKTTIDRDELILGDIPNLGAET